jgi:chromosome partitioning protein
MPGIDGEASRLPARGEVRGLLDALKLPINGRGRRRAALRAEWFASRDRPLDTDILAGPNL